MRDVRQFTEALLLADVPHAVLAVGCAALLLACFAVAVLVDVRF